ncbi:MAG: hypothetical protein VXY93_19005, partial [Pseudomonadota bacterium]|nr:hypothetical protein [Pseudomonadota bacterium]
MTGTLGGISTANLVGAHNNSHSASLEAEVGALHFYRNGANSGITNHPYALYQASGGWSTPYPDLFIAYHTGISLGGNNGYDGIRFFNDYTMATRILQVNGASNYIFKDVWMHTDPGEGFYSSGNGMHLYPNSGQSSYSPITITGNRGGYGGIFCDYSDVNWMHDASGNGGLYRQANGRWYNYHHLGN